MRNRGCVGAVVLLREAECPGSGTNVNDLIGDECCTLVC